MGSVKYRNALVLGGGGAKGFAHIGAVIALEEASLGPDIICGTSAGALAGAFYALHGANIKKFNNIEETKEFKILKNLKLHNIDFEEDRQSVFLKTVSTVRAKFSMLKMLRDTALLKKEDVMPVFKNLFGDTAFEEMDIPFTAAAFDLLSGRDVYIKSGPLWKGVLASCSIPGIFPPVEYENMFLVDGGVTNRLPVKCAALSGANNIVGIDLSRHLPFREEINSVVNLHLRIDALISRRFDGYNKTMSDIIVKPELGDMKWHEFKRYPYAMKQGEDAIKKLLPEIKRIRSRSYACRKTIRFFMGHIEQKRLKLLVDKDEFIFI